MELTLAERLFLRRVFKPTHLGTVEGDIWWELEQKLMFTSEERDNFKIVNFANGDISWDKSGDDYSVDIEIPSELFKIIRQTANDLNDKKRIPNERECMLLAKRIINV